MVIVVVILMHNVYHSLGGLPARVVGGIVGGVIAGLVIIGIIVLVTGCLMHEGLFVYYLFW